MPPFSLCEVEVRIPYRYIESSQGYGSNLSRCKGEERAAMRCDKAQCAASAPAGAGCRGERSQKIHPSHHQARRLPWEKRRCWRRYAPKLTPGYPHVDACPTAKKQMIILAVEESPNAEVYSGERCTFCGGGGVSDEIRVQRERLMRRRAWESEQFRTQRIKINGNEFFYSTWKEKLKYNFSFPGRSFERCRGTSIIFLISGSARSRQ